MIIIDKLKSLGVEITDEIEKALAGDWLSESEVSKKLAKMQVLEDENKDLKEKRDSLEKDLQSMKDSASDSDALNQKITDLTNTLEKERKERKEKDEIARLDSLVTDFFADKHFVNAITADAIKKQLVETLNSDEARGKSVSDLFDAIVKDEKGNYKPDIIVDDKTFKAQQNRSQIVGNNIGQPDGAKLSMAELMKLKNQNPDMDITPYLNRKKEK
nr:MAG TPA: minor structural protein [Caudoviricetes sp.]DAU21443.1 MAG TPA: minor structural protein [Caudoviricetes sp.]